jgi:hypothetical protein
MKPRTSFLILAAGTALSFSATAQEGPGQRLNPADMLKRADTNNDGKISKEEFMAARTAELGEQFARMDANADGHIDEQEIRVITERMRDAMSQRGPGGEGRGPGGEMRRPEGGPPPEGGFRRPPEGGPERRPEGGPPPEGRRPEGGPAMAGEMFDRMDEDKDGKLSRSEFEAGMGRLREMLGRGRGEGPGFGRPSGAPDGGGFRRPPTPGEGGDRPRPDGETRTRPRPDGEANRPKPEGNRPRGEGEKGKDKEA